MVLTIFWGLLRWRRIGMRLSEVCAQGRRSPTGAHTLGRVPRGSVTVRMYMSTPLWMREGTSLSPPFYWYFSAAWAAGSRCIYSTREGGHLYLTAAAWHGAWRPQPPAARHGAQHSCSPLGVALRRLAARHGARWPQQIATRLGTRVLSAACHLARRLTASAACRSARRSTAMAQLADRLSVDGYTAACHLIRCLAAVGVAAWHGAQQLR